MSRECLVHYPTVAARLFAIERSPLCCTADEKQQKDDALYQKVTAGIVGLREGGESVTQSAVSRAVGVSVSGLRLYPRTRMLLSELADANRPRGRRRPR